MFYNSDGIPTKNIPATGFWIQESMAGYILKEGDITFEIVAKCTRLREQQLASKIFGSVQDYYAMLLNIPMAYHYGGIDAEVNVLRKSSRNFPIQQPITCCIIRKLLKSISSFPTLKKDLSNHLRTENGFSQDIKLNKILPSLVTDFWKRVKTTLDPIK